MATTTNELNKAAIYGDHRNIIMVYGEHKAQPVGSKKGGGINYRKTDRLPR